MIEEESEAQRHLQEEAAKEELSITLQDGEGREKGLVQGEDQILMVFEGEYEPGDRILFGTDATDTYYVIRVDGAMDEAYVYLTKETVEYVIPFDEKKVSYNPASFTGDRHYITMRRAEDYENSCYRNLAKNVMDQHGDPGCYPHAHANVETRGESVFAARNAIDGVVANESHGQWPYESWGINRQDDAEITLEFGRPVDMDKLVLYTRADFPHDNWWVQATVTFSDGSSQVIHMEKSVKPHVFAVEKRQITWLRLSDLKKTDDPSPFPALTQVEVYGTNS